jgi:hypothetical protein
MGFFSSKSSSNPSSNLAEPKEEASYAEWMTYGKRQLYSGKTTAAAKAFDTASRKRPTDPLPLAFRSWAGRLDDKAKAIADAKLAVHLDAECAEAHMSLALALVTGDPDFEQAGVAFFAGMKKSPRDPNGAVLYIGVFLCLVEALSSMQEDADGLNYDFKSTPQRDAADWLLCGKCDAALRGFERIRVAGQLSGAATGEAATYWAMNDKVSANTCASLLLSSRAVEKPSGLVAALTIIRDASK